MSDCNHDRYKRGQGYCPDCGLYADDVESELVRFERDRLRAVLERIVSQEHVIGWSVAAMWARDALKAQGEGK